MAKQCFKNAAFVRMLMTVLSVVCLHTADAQTGASYGTIGDDLPPATEVVALCHQYNIQRIRLFNPNPSVLPALNGTNISVIVGVPNEDIIGIARDAQLAQSWVRNNILKYENVNFRYIAVGNEISPLDGGSAGIAPSVVPAVQNIYNAVSASGLGGRVKVSTALSFGVLGTSYPPSAGAFRPEIQSSYIKPLVQFLVKTRGPFLVNVYPYFAYVSNPNDIRLDYALFTSPSNVVRDGQYQYQNLFDAMVDAAHAALQKVGGDVEVVITETGWPSAGGTATTIDNARSYNSNLIKSVRNGTPRKPGKPIETYIFDLIDENQKSPELEKHWGLFLPNKQPKYPISFAK
ncbi:Glucan endo-1,3-beta-glucosidase, basic isoform [Sesamum angolense]|uniref:Glucan endo-1,3-beta-glucosidase, basic isoform n=1 Tax=Sesamum angolense TaxID=2727404 RepID=A0AAE1WFR6_9LAMI|nr:Glucan endo-1,3-beta-glucosidase, basic isoform [Sesamum angolense]